MSATFTTSEHLLGTDIISNVDAFSMWAWVRWTNVTGYRTLGGQQDAAAWGCKDGEMYLGTSSSDHMSGDTISTNTWYHCVWTVNGNAHLLYLNNVVALSVTDAASNNDLLIGGWGGTGGEFAGQLGPWGFINGTVLTADQVAALYRGGRRPRGIPTPTFWNPGFDGANPQTNWVPGGTGLTKTGTTVASTEEPNVVWQRQGALYVPTGAGGTDTPITVASGVYTYTGNAVGLLRGLKVSIAQGVYTKTGNDVGLSRGRSVAVDRGEYTYTGNAVTLRRTHILAVAQGIYAKVGNAISTLWGRRVLVAQGSYTQTGNDVGLTKGAPGSFTISVDRGEYTQTGFAIGLMVGRKVTVTRGEYAKTGNDIGLARGLSVSVTRGEYTQTGNAVTTLWKRVIAVAQGVYTYLGRNVTLQDSGDQATDHYIQAPGAEYNVNPSNSVLHNNPGAEYNQNPAPGTYNQNPEDE